MMYLVTYDLQSGQYDAVEDLINALGNSCKIQRTVWLIDSELRAAELRDVINSALKKGDKLFVIKCTKGWATSGEYPESTLDWIRKHT